MEYFKDGMDPMWALVDLVIFLKENLASYKQEVVFTQYFLTMTEGPSLE